MVAGCRQSGCGRGREEGRREEGVVVGGAGVVVVIYVIYL
jgi:hypothetical protein